MNKVFIIAEAGVNHNGNLELAKEMIYSAAHCGADAIKFQSFNVDKLVSKNTPKAEYQKLNTRNDESQYEMIKKLELSPRDHLFLIENCHEAGIKFLSSPFDIESINLLNGFGLEIFKIPSGEITNLPYLREIAKLNKQIILSTGMADLGEIEDALDILVKYGTHVENITVLHCTTEYPAPFSEVNLNAIKTIKKAFKVNIGYSDHTKGFEIPIAAVALGAKIIEKHFTLDRNMEGPDHKASLEPDELKKMISAIRNVEIALGSGIKKPSPSEIKNIEIARKSIISINKIIKGEAFTEKNIGIKRPGTGLSPMKWDELIGKNANRNYDEGEVISL